MWLSDFDLVLKDRVVQGGAVRIEDGLIAEVSERPVDGATVRGGGRLLLPGFVDIHGDMVEREVEPRPGVRMPLELSILEHDKKLAATGITTAYASLSFNPGSMVTGKMRAEDVTREIIEAIVSLKDELLIDHRIHARFEVTFARAVSVVEDLMRRGAVDLVSLMDHTPGQGQYRDVEKFAGFIANARGIDMAEAHAVLRQRMADAEAAGESVAATIDALTTVANEHGIAIASHDDDSAEKVALMAGLGAAISEFPVTLEAAREAKRRGMWTAMGAPNALRGKSYSGNLSARALYEAGMLDILAADYHPAAILPSIFLLADVRGGLPAAAALASLNPARAAGLHDRGAIEPGRKADLVVADRLPRPRLRATFCAGRMVFGDGTLWVAPRNEAALAS